MDSYNSIWINSIPRTGSMWTTNVVKEIFLKSNFNVYPKKMFKNETISEDEVIRITNDNVRSFDQTTGFQTGHISKKSNIDWTKVFNGSDVNKIIEVLDPIVVKMGYKSQK